MDILSTLNKLESKMATPGAPAASRGATEIFRQCRTRSGQRTNSDHFLTIVSDWIFCKGREQPSQVQQPARAHERPVQLEP